MKIYILFEDSDYGYNHGNVIGVFLIKKDAEDMKISGKYDDYFIEEHEVIE